MQASKAPGEIQYALQLPGSLYLENYARAWNRIGPNMINSVLITVPAVILSVFVGCLAAYPLSHVNIPGGRFIYLVLLAGLLIPHQAVQIPLFTIMRAIGLYNTIPGMWLVHTAYGIPFCTFFMRNFFSTVPRSMYEAAQIDGCGPSGYFFKHPASGFRIRSCRADGRAEPVGLERSVLRPDADERTGREPSACRPLYADWWHGCR